MSFFWLTVIAGFFGFVSFRPHATFGAADACQGADVNGDGTVNIVDLVTIARKFGQQVEVGVVEDVNQDGVVNIIDLVIIARHFGEKCALNEDLTFCNQADFSMAFVFLARNRSEVTSDRTEKLEAIKTAFAEDFSFATRGLAQMDTSYPVVVIVDDGALVAKDTNHINLERLIRQFYGEHPDDFDFVSVYSTFDDDFATRDNFGAFHYHVKWNIRGISNFLMSKYGRKGRLLGVNRMPNIEKVWSPKDELFRSMGLLHETGHRWCCYVGDNFARGQDGARLEVIQQGIHFYRGLSSPDASGDPMESDYWVSNGDGTYHRDNHPGRPRYHPFQLYFMGLLPESEYSKEHTIYDAGIVGKDFDGTKARFYKTVSVDDIISVVGERECVRQIPIEFPSSFRQRSAGGSWFASALRSVFWVLGD